ncbi:MAG: hypothetical protein AAGE52_32535 [Myxococcota bacterium]
MRVLLVCLALSFTGCVFNNISAEEKLRDSVVGLNDEVRWNRLDLATLRVAAPYKLQFRATHHGWHRDFQIADSEIIQVEVGDNRDSATSFVTVSWYDHATMILHDTTLRQRWNRTINGYMLTEEKVTDGNERLLEIPESLQNDDSDDEDDEEEEEAV